MKPSVWTFSFIGFIFMSVVLSAAISIIIPAIPNIMRERELTSTFITLAFASLLSGRFLASIFTGILLFRFRPHQLLFSSFALHIITMILLVFADSGFNFVTLRFVEGIFEGIVSVVLQVIVIGLSTKEDRGVKMGYMGSAYGLGFIIGPVIGGVSMKLFGSGGVFISTAILMVVSLGWLLLTYREIDGKMMNMKPQKTSFNFDFIKYIPYYSGPILQRVLVVSFAILLPLYLVDKFNMAPHLVGGYFTMSALITTVLLTQTGRFGRSPHRNYIVSFAIIIMGLSIFLFGIIRNQTIFTLAFLLETLAFTVMSPNSMKIFGDKVAHHPRRDEIIGTSSSVRELLNIALSFCLVPLYAVNKMLPWMFISITCFVLAVPYLRRQSIQEEVKVPEAVKLS